MANEASKIRPRVEKVVAKGKGLDLGCGPFKVSPNATGVDLGNYDGVEGMAVDEFLAHAPNESYDWVFTSHFLEHEPNVDEVLVNIGHVLKPGGTLMVYGLYYSSREIIDGADFDELSGAKRFGAPAILEAFSEVASSDSPSPATGGHPHSFNIGDQSTIRSRAAVTLEQSRACSPCGHTPGPHGSPSPLTHTGLTSSAHSTHSRGMASLS